MLLMMVTFFKIIECFTVDVYNPLIESRVMMKMMVMTIIIIISMTPQAQWKEECHKLRWLKEQYLLLYYQVEIFTVDHFLRQ